MTNSVLYSVDREEMVEYWCVDLSRDAKKQYLKLKRSGDNRKPPLMDVLDALVYDLKQNGRTIV